MKRPYETFEMTFPDKSDIHKEYREKTVEVRRVEDIIGHTFYVGIKELTSPEIDMAYQEYRLLRKAHRRMNRLLVNDKKMHRKIAKEKSTYKYQDFLVLRNDVSSNIWSELSDKKYRDVLRN